MNQDSIKEMLLKLEDTELEFSVTFTGKTSKKVNGLYKSDTCEILLHNKNFKNDNELIYTAIHEYAHHLINEEKKGMPYSARVHTNDYWARFHTLLEKAENQGIYTLQIEASPELEELTKEIKTNYLEKNGQLMIDFGKLLTKAYQLCIQAHIRYEDYVDRILRLPRSAAKTIGKISALGIAPEVGFENMKMIASLPKGEKRAEAQQQLLDGKSPDSVRAAFKPKIDADPKTMLQKEKKRLEKTIEQLKFKLEKVEEHLAEL